MEENFQNNQIFDFDLPDFSELKMISVSPKYLNIVLFNLSIFTLFIAGSVGVALYFFHSKLVYSKFGQLF